MSDPHDNPAARRILTHVAPDPKDGPLVGFLVTTFDLQPDFVDTDFFPTLLGIRAANDRSWNARLKMEHDLARAQAAIVVMAASRYQGRPRSLRVNVQPVAAQHVGVQHAKVTIVEQAHAIRLIVGSANLTEAGHRRNREVIATLKATQRDPRHASLILDAIRRCPARLRERLVAEEAGRAWLERAIERLTEWVRVATPDPSLRLLWGGGDQPLWAQLIDPWDDGDPIDMIHMVSPFWSDENGAGPVTHWITKLRDRGLLSPAAEVRLITTATHDGVHGWRPTLPATYLGPALSELGIRVSVVAADPQVDEGDVDLKGSSASRSLHAKVLALSSKQRDLAYVGSANMSSQGWGFSGDPNIEAGLAIELRGAERRELARLLPPTTGTPVRLDGRVAAQAVAEPPADAEAVPWPQFVESLELEHDGTDDRLRLCVRFASREVCGPWTVAAPGGDVVLRATQGRPSPVIESLGSEQLGALLRDKEAHIRWWALPEGAEPVAVPINVIGEARDRLPFSGAGRRPGEDALIAYYQARLEFSDLFPAPPGWEDGAEDDPTRAEDEPAAVDTSKIQSYQIREFVEALPGIARDLRGATTSEAAMRLALRGPVSPVALARAIVAAVDRGVRTPVAAAFQLAELRGCLAAAKRLEVPERLAEAWRNALYQADRELAQLSTQLAEKHPTEVGKNDALREYAAGVQELFAGEPR